MGCGWFDYILLKLKMYGRMLEAEMKYVCLA